MKKPILFALVTFVLILFAVESSPAQNSSSYPLWNGIEAGPHPVGFQVINYQDESRTPSDTTSDVNFFPIQISIWYPADYKWSAEKAMPFKEYFYLTEQKNDFKTLTAEQKEKAMDIFSGFTKFGAKIELSKEQLINIGNTPTAAVKNTEPVKEQFPVIIAGHDGGVWKGTTLNEFLASHGYVVISTGLLSETSRMISRNPQQALQRRIRTFEIFQEKMTDFTFVDDSKTGLLGINADGMTVLLYQMETGVADAVVSIDGWEGKNNGYQYVTENKNYDPEEFRVPFMEFQQHEETDREPLQLNTGIMENLDYSNRFSYVITDFGHAFLTGNTIAVPDLERSVVERYRFMFNSIREFYDGYVKGDIEALNNLLKEKIDGNFLFERNKKVKSAEVEG